MDKKIDPIPVPIRTLLELLGGELASVRFPDVDGEKLAAGVREAEQAAQAVAAAEAALTVARARLDEQQNALLARAQRALGYLRVFAEGDATLESRVEAIALPRRDRPPEVLPAAGEARRRGRPSKREASMPLLPSVTEPEVEGAAARPITLS
jgi:hypothetical protein